MNIALWVVQGFLAAAFLGAGATKVALPRKRLLDRGSAMAWAGDFSEPAVKAIGVLEVLGAVGVILPPTLGVVPVLAPVAATGLLLLMIGATVTHLRRGETAAIGAPVLLGLLALAVAILRFGPYSL